MTLSSVATTTNSSVAATTIPEIDASEGGPSLAPGRVASFDPSIGVQQPESGVSRIREITAKPPSEGAGSAVGNRVVDYLDKLHQARDKVGTAESTQAAQQVAAVDMSAKGGGLLKGPAAANLSTSSKPVDPVERQLKFVQESFDYGIGVALVTRTGSSLAGAMNKLMSS